MFMPRRHPPVVTAVAAAAALLVAGCGGGSSPGVANLTSATSTSSPGPSGSASPPSDAQIEGGAIRFAQCMRSNGVPNFPDPQPGGHLKVTIHQLGTGPQVQRALSACQHLLPAGRPSQSAPPSRAQTVALLAFARCLRSHGFPSFPDPTSSGQLTHEMLAGAGIDLHDPTVVQAADACTSVTHGVITKAVVARFVAGS